MKEKTRSKEETIGALHAVAAEMHDRMTVSYTHLTLPTKVYV